MLSLRELQRVVGVLNEGLSGARVDKIVQPGAMQIVLVLRPPAGEGGKVPLLLSCRPHFGRVSMLASVPAAPREPPAFVSHLRTRLGRPRFRGARLLAEDRQLALRLEGREGCDDLVLSLLGPRSNLYLVDQEGKLCFALRPLAETRRDLALGAPWRDPDSRPPSAGEDRFATVSDHGLLAAIEGHYRPREAEEAREVLLRRLSHALRKQDAALARKRGKVEQDLAAGARAEEYRRQGELLKGILARVPAKAASVTAQDYETGVDVTIPLDPARNAAGNLEEIFRRQRKALKKSRIAGQELADLEEREGEAAALRDELTRLAEARDSSGLESLASRAPMERLLQRYAPEKVAAPPPARRQRGPFEELPARLRPRRYRSSDGLEIWVGRSDEGNDLLSTRLSRGNDLFFHLEGSPGSHVVLRTDGRKDPPAESLLEACELAVHFSKQKATTRASVHVAAIKDVKKPRGAKPGLVMVYRGRNVDLRRDPERLHRVLGARIED